MEPLLNNKCRNPVIEPIMSQTLNKDFPVLYACSDHVNATNRDNEGSLQALIKEYERLTKISGWN